jgi:hypothetical protein
LAALFNITGWNQQPWYNTGGTRAKKYVQDSGGKFYYFKQSQFKPGKDYKFEFWSEVIASEVGQFLNFNVLRYDIAIDGDIMGCISASMIDPDKEELIEGIKYLQAHDNAFAPEVTSLRKRYTFQLIEQALTEFDLGRFIDLIIEMIIFDSIIGNSDRHQENWAFIDEYSAVSELIKSYPGDIAKFFLTFHKPKSFAPIYDNGSSLGRELTDERIFQILNNKDQLQRYVERGLAEIHWNELKITHFDLIRHLLNSSHHSTVVDVLTRVGQNFEAGKIVSIVNEIDTLVPESHAQYRLPIPRKQLIINVICLRIDKLRTLLYEGI